MPPRAMAPIVTTRLSPGRKVVRLAPSTSSGAAPEGRKPGSYAGAVVLEKPGRDQEVRTHDMNPWV